MRHRVHRIHSWIMGIRKDQSKWIWASSKAKASREKEHCWNPKRLEQPIKTRKRARRTPKIRKRPNNPKRACTCSRTFSRNRTTWRIALLFLRNTNWRAGRKTTSTEMSKWNPSLSGPESILCCISKCYSLTIWTMMSILSAFLQKTYRISRRATRTPISNSAISSMWTTNWFSLIARMIRWRGVFWTLSMHDWRKRILSTPRWSSLASSWWRRASVFNSFLRMSPFSVNG